MPTHTLHLYHLDGAVIRTAGRIREWKRYNGWRRGWCRAEPRGQRGLLQGGQQRGEPIIDTRGCSSPSSSSRASSVSGAAARPVDSVVLAVATLAGLLYEYTVTGLLGGGTVSPAGTGAGGDTVVVLEGEWALQGSTSLIGG